MLGFWDVCIGRVLVGNAADGGSPGSRARQSNRNKIAKHSKYVDVEKKLHGFALDTCRGMDDEANKSTATGTKVSFGEEDGSALSPPNDRVRTSWGPMYARSSKFLHLLR